MFNEAIKNAKLCPDCKLSKTFKWIYVTNSLLSTVTNANQFTAVLEAAFSDFYGCIFQVISALCYNDICLKITHEHDYLTYTVKSKGLSGHMLWTELYICPQLQCISIYTSNYKSPGKFCFVWFYIFLCICCWHNIHIQNIRNFRSKINIFLLGLQHLKILLGWTCLSRHSHK